MNEQGVSIGSWMEWKRSTNDLVARLRALGQSLDMSDKAKLWHIINAMDHGVVVPTYVAEEIHIHHELRLAAELKVARLQRRMRHIPASIRKQVLERDGYQCRYCATPLGGTVRAHIDHYDPNGPELLVNLVAACEGCNIRKRDIPPRQLYRRIGMRLLGGKPETPLTARKAIKP